MNNYLSMLLAMSGGNGSGGVRSWNDLPDKPFGEEVTTVSEPLNIIVPEIPDGLECVVDGLYKISDIALTDEQLKTVTVVSHGSPMVLGELWDTLVQYGMAKEDYVTLEYAAWFVRNTTSIQHSTEGEVTLEPGIYLTNNGSGFQFTSITSTAPIEQTTTVLKKLDAKYLPDTIARKSDIPVIPEIPTFDLTAMGLPAVVPNGEIFEVTLEDNSAVLEAMSKGAVKFLFKANIGMEVTVGAIVSSNTIVEMGGWAANTIMIYGGAPLLVGIEATTNAILAKVITLSSQ